MIFRRESKVGRERRYISEWRMRNGRGWIYKWMLDKRNGIIKSCRNGPCEPS